jgi:methylthioribose-1-phosphate isomerase
MGAESITRTIWWEDDTVRLVDQSRLPLVGDIIECATYDGVIWAIKGMAVRGAPVLGVAAAMAMAVFARRQSEHITEVDDFIVALANVADEVCATRPTAVNLFWGAERMIKVAQDNKDSLDVAGLRDRLVEEALAMAEEDVERNHRMGAHGAGLIGEDAQLMTHCNAGSLATVHYGTALGVVYALQEQDRTPRVWVNETRPVLQGARLTAWELMVAGVPCKIVTDSMAGALMASDAVDAVIVGADRIAANGDVANKIGTYSLAVLADRHDVPFYVVAPTSTIDLRIASGDEIKIEERDEREIAGIAASAVFESPSEEAASAFASLTGEGPYAFEFDRGHELVVSPKGDDFQLDGWWRFAPLGASVFNPAFDVTPADLVTAIVTENGVAEPPFVEGLAGLCDGSGAIHELTEA